MATHAFPARETISAEESGTADSYVILLADVLSEMSIEQCSMFRPESDEAMAGIRAIAENVRKRQAESADRSIPRPWKILDRSLLSAAFLMNRRVDQQRRR